MVSLSLSSTHPTHHHHHTLSLDIRRRGGKFAGAEILIAVGARRYVFFHSVGRLGPHSGGRARLKQFCQKFAHNILFW